MLRLVPATTKKPAAEEDDKGSVSITVRMPSELFEKLQGMRARGYGTSATIFLMMRAYMAIEDVLGPLWWDVEKAAAEQRVGVGVILGRLAKATLEGRQKR